MSTAEAEYVSLSACCAQVIWMRTQLLNYGYKYNRIPMYCDSKSAIAISCNPVKHFKIIHIDIWCHFIKEHVEKGTVEIYFVGIEYQLADLFTKALPKERFEYQCLKKTRYAVSGKVDMAYWAGFLRVCATFKSISDIISNLLDLLYLRIVIFTDTAYVDSMDTPYWELVKRVFL
ncbi:hypothetical protein Tco_0879329 [Tanacetum coccineum]